jgi:cytochrome c oxidase assembly factor CtaG
MTPVLPAAKEPFVVYTTAHIVELTGRMARTLAELRDGIREVTGSSIFHHTFGALRDRPFAAHRYTSDFARWAAEVLQDWPVADRLSVVRFSLAWSVVGFPLREDRS